MALPGVTKAGGRNIKESVPPTGTPTVVRYPACVLIFLYMPTGEGLRIKLPSFKTKFTSPTQRVLVIFLSLLDSIF